MLVTFIRWFIFSAIIILSCCCMMEPIPGHEEVSKNIAFFIVCGITGWLLADYNTIRWYKKANEELANQVEWLMDKNGITATPEPVKIIRLTKLNEHLVKMYEGWLKQYREFPTLWDAIETYYKDCQISGDKSFILDVKEQQKEEEPKPHSVYYTITTYGMRVTDDIKALREIGVPLQINEYTREEDPNKIVRVLSCTIPEWMLGMKKKDILKGYKEYGC